MVKMSRMNSPNAGGCSEMARLTKMIVRLDLESASPSVANVDDAGVLSSPCPPATRLPASRQRFAVHAR